METTPDPPLLPHLRFSTLIVVALTGAAIASVYASNQSAEAPSDSLLGFLRADTVAWGRTAAVALIGLIGSAHFTILRHALFSLDASKIHDLARSRPKSARLLRKIRRHLDNAWFTLLSGSLLFNLLLALALGRLAAATPGAERSPLLAAGLALLGIIAVMMILGEMLPGMLVARALPALAPAAARCILFWSVVLSPWTYLPLRVMRFAARLRRIDLRERCANLEVEQRLLTLIGVGEVDVSLEEEEREMIDHALEFGQNKTGDIMTARSEIIGLDTSSSQHDALDFMRRTPRSRVPIYQGSFDEIVGVLHTKQILLNPETDYHELAHPAIFVEEHMGLVRLLALMRHERAQFVVVLDEYGATAGVASFDDLLAAIVGDMPDSEREESAR